MLSIFWKVIKRVPLAEAQHWFPLSGKIDGHWHAHNRTSNRSDAPLWGANLLFVTTLSIWIWTILQKVNICIYFKARQNARFAILFQLNKFQLYTVTVQSDISKNRCKSFGFKVMFFERMGEPICMTCVWCLWMSLFSILCLKAIPFYHNLTRPRLPA